MQPFEEFEAFCNRLDKELEEEIERQIGFIRKMTNTLVELSIQYNPGIKKYRHLFIRDLTNEAHKHAVEINETLDYFLYNDSDEDIATLKQSKIPNWNVTGKTIPTANKKSNILTSGKQYNSTHCESDKISFQV